VIPSREPIPSYHDPRLQIEQLIGRINGEFTAPGNWVPIHYVCRRLDPLALSACYRAARVALVTPLKDGMDPVAKEYCAASIEEDCVLILSEFAGAAAQCRHGALLVNPHDIEGTADAIHRACRMDRAERLRRMRRRRREMRRRDAFWWVDSFMRAAAMGDLAGRDGHSDPGTTPAAPACAPGPANEEKVAPRRSTSRPDQHAAVRRRPAVDYNGRPCAAPSLPPRPVANAALRRRDDEAAPGRPRAPFRAGDVGHQDPAFLDERSAEPHGRTPA
jgi:hypothetical protein